MSATPTNVHAVWSVTSVTVTWGVEGSAPSQIIHYRKMENPAVPWTNKTLGSAIRTYTISELTPATEYEIEVRESGGHEVTITGKTLPEEHKEEAGVLWRADAETAGKAGGDIFKEWVGYSGAGAGGVAHPYITVVKTTDEGQLPLQGEYMYRYEMIYSNAKYHGSPYGDRLEVGNEAFAEGSKESPTNVPKSVSEWVKGTELWISAAWTMPVIQEHEVAPGPGGNTYGCLPILQFHPEGSGAPFLGLRLEGTNYANVKKEKPHFQIVGTAGLPSPSNNGIVGGVWYRFMFHIKVHPTEGFCEAWISEGGGDWSQYIDAHDIQTLPTGKSYVFPCQGGPRKEETAESYYEGADVPTSIWYMDAYWFAETRAALEEAFA